MNIYFSSQSFLMVSRGLCLEVNKYLGVFSCFGSFTSALDTRHDVTLLPIDHLSSGEAQLRLEGKGAIIKNLC